MNSLDGSTSNCRPSARQHRDAPNPHGPPAPWSGLVWCPEIPAFGHDIWVTVARIAEKTKRIKFGPSVLIPSYRHPMAQASAIATLDQIAPGRLMVGFGTGFTGRAGMGKKPLGLPSMRTHITQVKALLCGDVADIDGGLAQILASDGWLPDRPIK